VVLFVYHIKTTVVYHVNKQLFITSKNSNSCLLHQRPVVYHSKEQLFMISRISCLSQQRSRITYLCIKLCLSLLNECCSIFSNTIGLRFNSAELIANHLLRSIIYFTNNLLIAILIKIRAVLSNSYVSLNICSQSRTIMEHQSLIFYIVVCKGTGQ